MPLGVYIEKAKVHRICIALQTGLKLELVDTGTLKILIYQYSTYINYLVIV